MNSPPMQMGTPLYKLVASMNQGDSVAFSAVFRILFLACVPRRYHVASTCSMKIRQG